MTHPPIKKTRPRESGAGKLVFNGDRAGPTVVRQGQSRNSSAASESVVFGHFGRNRPIENEPLPGYLIQAFARKNSLSRVAKARLKTDSVLRVPHGWIRVISNVLNVTSVKTGRDGTEAQVRWFAEQLGLPPFEATISLFLDESTVLLPARECGHLLHIVAAERLEHKLYTMDAVDDPAARRDKRLKAEASRKYRLKMGAKSREQSLAKTLPWQLLNMSRSKFYASGLHKLSSTPP